MGARSTVPAGAVERHDPSVARRHEWAFAGREAPHGQPWRIVHAVDRIDGKAFEQAFLDHQLAAAQPLLGGLEDEVHMPAEVGILGEISRCAEQHRGMAVVPTGVHLAGNCRAMIASRDLPDVQGVEVGPQPDRALARTFARQRADDAGPCDTLDDVDSP
jgi:hypothetical protein